MGFLELFFTTFGDVLPFLATIHYFRSHREHGFILFRLLKQIVAVVGPRR